WIGARRVVLDPRPVLRRGPTGSSLRGRWPRTRRRNGRPGVRHVHSLGQARGRTAPQFLQNLLPSRTSTLHPGHCKGPHLLASSFSIGAHPTEKEDLRWLSPAGPKGHCCRQQCPLSCRPLDRDFKWPRLLLAPDMIAATAGNWSAISGT